MQLSPLEVSELTKKESPVSAAIARSKKTGKEFCNCCGAEMDFPLMTHIDAPIRYKDGASYREGAGQTCAQCEIKISKI